MSEIFAMEREIPSWFNINHDDFLKEISGHDRELKIQNLIRNYCYVFVIHMLAGLNIDFVIRNYFMFIFNIIL